MELPAELRVPAESRLDRADPLRDEILHRHEAAMAIGAERYVDPATGYMVFTARYLWDRGTCCESGCRHCPYVERR